MTQMMLLKLPIFPCYLFVSDKATLDNKIAVYMMMSDILGLK